MLNNYFVEKLSLASGIMFAGGSCGQLVMPHVLAYLLEEYTLRQTFVIWGACFLQMWWAGCLFRPTSYYIRQRRPVITKQLQNCLPKGTERHPDIIHSKENDVHTSSTGSDTEDDNPHHSKPIDNAGYINPAFRKDESIRMFKDHGFSEVTHRPGPSKRPWSQNYRVNRSKWDNRERVTPTEFTGTGHTKVTPDNTNDVAGPKAMSDRIDTVSLSVQKKEDAQIAGEDVPTIKQEPKRLWSRFKTPIVELCQNSPFMVFVPGFAFALNGYLSAYVYVPGYSEELGMSHEQIATVLSVGGATDMVTRIGIGWFNNLGLVHSSLIMACRVFVGGAIILPCVLFPSYESTIVLIVVGVAMFGAPLQVLQPLTIRGFVGNDRFPYALAFNQACYSVFVSLWAPSALGMALQTTPIFGQLLHLNGKGKEKKN